jgi:hypothetical protein
VNSMKITFAVPAASCVGTFRKRPVVRFLLIVGSVLCLFLHSVMAGAADSENTSFEQGAASVLVRRCLECHQAGNPSGNLVLATHSGLLQGGESGPSVIAGNSSDSLLLQRILAGEMPPAKRGISQKLPQQEIDILKSWIDGGAKWPDGRTLDLFESTSDVRGGRDWWSLRPVVRPDIPQEHHVFQGDNPIDAFVGSELVRHQLTPAPAADRRTLIRRLYSTTVGLPPSAETIERFVADPAPDADAFGRLVDQQLASTHFGERWARHWLDVARYAESCGYERDQTKRFAWKYRDWVVNAFNSDMPYDQFIREQLAGDELPDRTEQSLIATGFLRLGTWNDEPNDPQDYLYERLEDMVHATSSAFLGLTVKCARCHDHKFDPIPQADYYRMAAAFWAGPIQPRDSKLLGGPTAEELGVSEVFGWTDITANPAPLHLLKNGERHHPQQVVQPASLSVIEGEFREYTDDSAADAKAGAKTTGRRRQLAEWIASERNPLTARVIVNRIWLHYFGDGLVRSPDNFGFTGEKPTHPELLDYLASELMRGGWKLKPVHRLILTSHTWQQASLHPKQDQYNLVDSGNHWIWRANRRRVDAETLRDSLLAAAGELDLRAGGPGFFPSVSPDALEGLSRKASAWTASSPAEQRRRSLYIFSQRSLLPPLMTTFDQCDTTLPCGQRDVTTVAPQALTLLNNDFVHDRAQALAAQLLVPENSDPQRVNSIWRAVLGRSPDSAEQQAALRHVRKQLQSFTAARDAAARISPAEGAHDPENRGDLDSHPPGGLILHLDATAGVQTDENGRVLLWRNQVADHHHAISVAPQHAPVLQDHVINQLPALRFDGQGKFLQLDGQLLQNDECTIFAVVTDQGVDGLREILSNWNGTAGNSTTSLFLGLSGKDGVRFSDDFAAAGVAESSREPFLLTATNGPEGAAISLQDSVLSSRTQRLSERRLDTPWVIGQQGNINGEYWQGTLAQLRVYDRQLSQPEVQRIQRELMIRYALKPRPDQETRPQLTPDHLAWASLCLVLMNSNEFLYID